jgi:FkbM family methyltransferase
MKLKDTQRKVRRELLKMLSKRFAIRSASIQMLDQEISVPLMYGLGADHLGRTAIPWNFHFLEAMLRLKPGALLDIGANVGLYLIWLKVLDSRRRYVGFEPNPACYFYLQELILNNKFELATTLPFALLDSEELHTFFVKRLGDKMGSLLDVHRAGEDRPRTFDLITQRGDEVINKLALEEIAFIKIDVEGAELEVLKGLSGTLSRFKPVIICDIFPITTNHSSDDQKLNDTRARRITDTLNLLSDYNYRLLSLDSNDRLQILTEAAEFNSEQAVDRVLAHKDDCDAIIETWQSANRDQTCFY